MPRIGSLVQSLGHIPTGNMDVQAEIQNFFYASELLIYFY